MIKYRTVKLIHPSQNPSQIIVSTSRVPLTPGTTIYQTVSIFKTLFLKPPQIKLSSQLVTARVLLRGIINLHNANGVRDPAQIKSMVQQIKSGKDIFTQEGLPNIKLVKTKDKEWLLFDGHHSMLAYLLSGKNYLHEIPHLVVENGENKFVTAEEIAVFFGKHLALLENKSWRDYVINWQAPQKEQLQSRVQKNMGELLDSLRVKITQREPSD